MPSATPTSSSATASMSMPSGSRSSPHLAGVCGASTTKRARATKAEVAARRAALHDLAEEMEPISVRGALLQATVRGLVEKTELGYRQIQRDVAVMRKASDLPTTGWPRQPLATQAVVRVEARPDTARLPRRALWADADASVEVLADPLALASSTRSPPCTSAHGGARVRQAVVPAQRRRGHRRPRCAGLQSMPAKRSKVSTRRRDLFRAPSPRTRQSL